MNATKKTLAHEAIEMMSSKDPTDDRFRVLVDSMLLAAYRSSFGACDPFEDNGRAIESLKRHVDEMIAHYGIGATWPNREQRAAQARLDRFVRPRLTSDEINDLETAS